MRSERWFRGFLSDALNALVRSSAEKSLRESWLPVDGIGMESVMFEVLVWYEIVSRW